MIPWLVLRADNDAQQLVVQLRARGVDARAAPAIERIGTTFDSDLLARLRASPDALVLLSSAFAVDTVVPVLPAHVRVGVMGHATDARAREAGLNVTFVANGGVHALYDAARSHCRIDGVVVHPTSDVALLQPPPASMHALAQHAQLWRVAAYRTQAAPALARTLRDLHLLCANYVVTSPSVVHALHAVAHPTALVCVCRGVSAAQQWRSVFPDACTPVCVGADQSLIDAISTIEHPSLHARGPA